MFSEHFRCLKYVQITLFGIFFVTIPLVASENRICPKLLLSTEVDVRTNEANKPKVPPHHFVFAIDKVGMSVYKYDPKYPSVVIIARELWEKYGFPDHIESDDYVLLKPILNYLRLQENMSNEFQATDPITEEELKNKLTELGLDFNNDLQEEVDEMGAI